MAYWAPDTKPWLLCSNTTADVSYRERFHRRSNCNSSSVRHSISQLEGNRAFSFSCGGESLRKIAIL